MNPAYCLCLQRGTMYTNSLILLSEKLGSAHSARSPAHAPSTYAWLIKEIYEFYFIHCYCLFVVLEGIFSYFFLLSI